MTNLLKKSALNFKAHPVKSVIACGLILLLVADLIYVSKIWVGQDYMFGYLLIYGLFFIQVPAFFFIIISAINKYVNKGNTSFMRELILLLLTIIFFIGSGYLRQYMHKGA